MRRMTDHEAHVLTQDTEGLGGFVTTLLAYTARLSLLATTLLFSGDITKEGNRDAVHNILTRAHLIVSQQTDDEVDRGKDKTYEDRNEGDTQRVGADGLRGSIIHIKHVGTILRHSLTESILLTLVQQLRIEALTDLQTTINISLFATLVRYLGELREEA